MYASKIAGDLRFAYLHELDIGDANLKKSIPLRTGFESWHDYAIATMDARGALLDALFTDDDPLNQEDIRAAAKLDALRAKAAS